MKLWDLFDDAWPDLAIVVIIVASFWLGLLVGSVSAKADALAKVSEAVEMAEQAQDIAADTLPPEPQLDATPACKQPTPIVREAEAPARPAPGALSRDEVRALLERACEMYGITGSEREWLVSKGLAIAWRESRYRPGVVNASGHAGLFQFSAAWGTLSERTDPWWACRRFVKAYAEGGRSALMTHWAATY